MRVAINGTGVAGPTLAYWLRHYGHEAVLFEKAPKLRTGGYAIDFWGTGYDITEKMGLVPTLHERGYQMQALRMVDARGETVAGMSMASLGSWVGGRFVTILRGDIAASLFEACGDVDARFGVSIDAIEDHAEGVHVELSDGTREDFDAVVGADGLHSRVRELAFGPEHQFEHRLGVHVAAAQVRGYPKRDELQYISYTEPKRQVARIALRDDMSVILFVFRDELLDADPRGVDDIKSRLREIFGDMAWEVRDILGHVDELDEIYFDRVSQIRMDRWSKGRVALVGDAGACASLLAGEGTGLAITEAYILAGELHEAGGDVGRAFERYEARLREFIVNKQKGALGFINFFAPKSRFQMRLRDFGIRLASKPPFTGWLVGRSLRDDLVLPDYRAP